MIFIQGKQNGDVHKMDAKVTFNGDEIYSDK